MNSRDADYIDVEESSSSSKPHLKRKRTESDAKLSNKKRRLIYNRTSARASRKRKKEEIETMQRTIDSQAAQLASLTPDEKMRLAPLQALYNTIEQQANELVNCMNKIATLEAENNSLQVMLEEKINIFEAEIASLLAENTDLQAEKNEYEAATYNPETRCYTRGTIVGLNIPPTLFFKQEVKFEPEQAEESRRVFASEEFHSQEPQVLSDIDNNLLLIENESLPYPSSSFGL